MPPLIFPDDLTDRLRTQAELAVVYEGALRKSLLELLRLVDDLLNSPAAFTEILPGMFVPGNDAGHPG